MSTWLDQWDRRYTDRVRLLVEILPVLAQEPRFALKGGTAINLFEHDLPRLSVDIDLAWLPVHDYAEDARLIAEALGRLAEDHLASHPLMPRLRRCIDCDSADANYEYVLKGLGVAWMPWSMVQRDCQAGRLAIAGDSSLNVHFDIRLYRPKRHLGTVAEQFWNDITSA